MKAIRNIFILIIIVTNLAIGLSLVGNKPVINDSTEYLQSANNLLKNNTLYSGDLNKPLDYRLYTKRTIGYPVFITLSHRNHYVIRIAQCLLIFLNFYIGLLLIKHFSNKRQVFIVFGIGYALHFALIFHTGFVLSDLLLTSIITLASLCFISKRESLKNKVVVLSILWAASVLIKPVMLPSLIFVPIVFVWLKVKRQKWYLSLALPLTVVLISSLYNHSFVNQYEYSSISTINLAQYNAKLTISKKYGFDSAQRFVEAKELAIPRSIEQYDYYKKNATRFGTKAILENPFAYIKVHTLGMVKMLLDPGRFELYTCFGEQTNTLSLTELLFAGDFKSIVYQLKKNPALLALFLILLCIATLKFFVALVSIKHWKKHLFHTILILYFLVITGPVGAARFFLPVSVIYLVMASEGFSNVLNLFQKGSKR